MCAMKARAGCRLVNFNRKSSAKRLAEQELQTASLNDAVVSDVTVPTPLELPDPTEMAVLTFGASETMMPSLEDELADVPPPTMRGIMDNVDVTVAPKAPHPDSCC